jgi:phosphatidylinositol glycan class U
VSTPQHTSSRKASQWPPWAVAAAFLFNPFTIATCIARPTVVFTNTAILTAIARAVAGRGVAAVLALAMAAYLSLYPVLLLPPMILLVFDSLPVDRKGSLGSFAAKLGAVFAAAAAGLGGLSCGITGGSWEFLASTYGVHLLLPDLTPNVGLWWYFFIEMFDSFREFFLCVFQLHLAVYVGGLCLRLR